MEPTIYNLKFGVVFVSPVVIILTMKHGGRVEICVLAGVLLSAPAIAATSADNNTDSPYSAIIERNVFNLHAPPPPINPADLIKHTPPPKITLTGITTILGKKVTFLTTPPVKPGAPPDAVMLTEGQALNDIEVKRIDEKANVVDVINHGEAQTLDFENNGAKPSGAPPLAMPTASPPPSNVTPMPAPGTVIRPLRSLSPRTNPDNNNNGNNGLGGANGQQTQNSTMTAEEQVALIEIQRYQAIKNNDPVKDLLPPTQMTPEITGKPASPGSPSGF